MTARGAAIQGALALGALALAYVTWQRQPERAPGEVVVLDLARHDFVKVRLEDGAKWVELEPKDGTVWLRMAPRPEAKTPERRLRGSEGANRLIERFAPLHASRALGMLSAEKLKEFGLAAPKKKLIVTGRGGVSSFLVGNSPYGVSDPYVKDERTGSAYVFGGSILSDLEAAAVRLVDRTLHSFNAAEFDSLVIAVGPKQRELLASEGKGALPPKLFAKQSPDKLDGLAKNWHDKLWRLVPVELLGEGENPPDGAPQVALKVTYRMGGKDQGWIELARGALPAALPDNASLVPPRAPEIFARTEHTVGWVKMSGSADELIKEADKVVGQP